MAYFSNPTEYLETGRTVLEKIEKIDQMITALEDTLLNGAGSADLEELQINDGQTIVKTIYKGIDQVNTAIEALEQRRNRLQKKLTGHVTRLKHGGI